MKKLKNIIIIISIVLMYASVYIYWNQAKASSERTPVNSEIVKETTVIKELNLSINKLDTLNPINTQNKNIQNISKLIYEPLFSINEEDKLTNVLIEEYAQMTETSYLLKLNENTYWCNGEELTANDILYTIEYIQESENSIYKESVKNIQNIKIIDELLFKIDVLEPDGDFVYNLTFPIINKKENIGTGMFKVTNINNDEITLAQNNYYTKTKPVLERINIGIYDDILKIYVDFKTGKIDVLAVEDEDYIEIIGDFGYDKKEYGESKILIYSKKLYGEIAPNSHDIFNKIETWRKIL